MNVRWPAWGVWPLVASGVVVALMLGFNATVLPYERALAASMAHDTAVVDRAQRASPSASRSCAGQLRHVSHLLRATRGSMGALAAGRALRAAGDAQCAPTPTVEALIGRVRVVYTARRASETRGHEVAVVLLRVVGLDPRERMALYVFTPRHGTAPNQETVP